MNALEGHELSGGRGEGLKCRLLRILVLQFYNFKQGQVVYLPPTMMKSYVSVIVKVAGRKQVKVGCLVYQALDGQRKEFKYFKFSSG